MSLPLLLAESDKLELMRKITPMLLVFTSLLAVFVTYVGFRIAENIWHWAILGAVAALIFSFPFVHWKYEKFRWPRAKVILQRSLYLGMGFASWLFALTVIRDLSIFLTWNVGGYQKAYALADYTHGTPIFLIELLFTIAGTWQAYYGLKVREVRIPIIDLPLGLVGFRIAQISDLHIGPTIGAKYVTKVVSLIESLHPDITALTGDIGDGEVAALQKGVAPLMKLFPAGKVFYVPGNHEYYWKVNEWLTEFTRLGADVLLNRGVSIDHNGHKVWIGGVSDPVAIMMNKDLAPDVAKAAEGGENADFKLLLSHRPGMLREASKAGFDLQLSGHTHGGQFFPWTYVAKLFHEYLIGLKQFEQTWLYISPGTGSWGPPIRIGTTPEVTLLRLEKA